MKIKIVRQVSTKKQAVVYDIYEGFSGIPSTLPFRTKWILDKAGLSEDELLHRMRLGLTTIGKLKIKIEDGGIC